MPLIPAPTYTFAPGATILSAEVNANFTALRAAINASCVFTDVAASISAAHTFTGLQTFTAGVALTGATGLTVAATVSASGGFLGALTGNVTGNVTGALTGNADTATALQTARTIGLTGDVTATGVSFNGTGNITLTAAIATGVIVNADISGSAAIAYSKLALTGAILNADISASAAIADTKLATISTAGKVSNSATTATSANTASAIVARDASGDFSAGVITGTRLNNSGATMTIRGVTYTMPAADGSSGQVLQTNGSGTLSWAAASSGFVTGSGTTGTVPKWSSTSGLGNSIMVESSGTIRFGTNPGQSGIIGIPNDTWITARNSGNSADLNVIKVNTSGSVLIGSTSLVVTASGGLTSATLTTGTTTLNGVGYTWPGADGTNGYVLSTNGSGTLSWVAQSGGGISGLTTGTIPKAASSTTLADSLISESGSTVQVNAHLDLNNGIGSGSGRLKINGTQVVGTRITGYGTPTSGARGGSWDATTASLQNVAETVAALVADLKTHGLIGV